MWSRQPVYNYMCHLVETCNYSATLLLINVTFLQIPLPIILCVCVSIMRQRYPSFWDINDI